MDIDTTIRIIQKHRQAFAFGVEGVHTLFNAGIEAGEPMKPLRTSITDELVHVSFLVPRAKMNTQLEQAATNRLAMQLLVGTGDAVKQYVDTWADHPAPEIRFLRLIRNGAAHDNRLYYTETDPRPDTAWRGVELTEEMEGDVIFTDISDLIWGAEFVDMDEGFMQAGDALALTTDILERLLPESETYDAGNVFGLTKDDER